MTSKYSQIAKSESSAPVTEQIRHDQVQNNAGGYVFGASNLQRLDRFLILGSESNTFYQGNRSLTMENVSNLLECIEKDGVGTVKRIVEIRKSGRSYRSDACILAILYCLKKGDVDTRRLAATYFKEVAVTGSDVLMALDLFYALGFGMSKVTRRAFSEWYTSKTPDNLAFQVIKYRNRNGMGHDRPWQASHGKPKDFPHLMPILTRLEKGWDDALTAEDKDQIPQIVKDFVNLKGCVKDPEAAAFMIDSNKSITWEMIPTEVSNDHNVQLALLKNMQVNAMVRNLAKYTAHGLFEERPEALKIVLDKLNSVDQVKRSKIHPFRLYVAAKQYGMGHGDKGNLTWTPNHRIIDALERAFEAALNNNLETSESVYVIGVDISGSMSDPTSVASISAREAAIVMSFILARQYPNSEVIPFHVRTFPAVRAVGRSLSDYVSGFIREASGTDCSVLFKYATTMKSAPDGIISLTDGETWSGTHPFKVLDDLRNSSKKRIKSILVPIIANRTTINRPDDLDSYEIVGFDSGMMETMRQLVDM